MSGGGEEAGFKGDQAVAGAVRIGCGGDANSGSGGGTDVEVGGDAQNENGDGYGLSWWENNIENVTLGMEPNAPLVYAPVLEHHSPYISTLGYPGG